MSEEAQRVERVSERRVERRAGQTSSERRAGPRDSRKDEAGATEHDDQELSSAEALTFHGVLEPPRGLKPLARRRDFLKADVELSGDQKLPLDDTFETRACA